MKTVNIYYIFDAAAVDKTSIPVYNVALQPSREIQLGE